MKKTKRLLSFVAGLSFALTVWAGDYHTDMQRAIELMDSGKYVESIALLDSMSTIYPDDYYVMYEKGFAHYLSKDFKAAVDMLERAVNHPGVTDQAYQMLGNVYDDSGDSQKAIKVYGKGLEKFPLSGPLHLEMGTAYWRLSESEKAAELYKKGINVDPTFPSNYYLMAEMMYVRKDLVQTILYAESMALLDPNSERIPRIAELVEESVNGLIKIQMGKNDSGKRNMQLNVFLPGNNIEEEALMFNYQLGLAVAFSNDSIVDADAGLTLKNMTMMRCEAVKKSPERAEALFPILGFQKKIIEAGHWEAYNMWLLSTCVEAESDKWFEDNPEAFEAFAEWFNNNNFSDYLKEHSKQ